MNERIKEIWEEATVSVWPRPGKFTAGEYDYHIEKFAELIVRECFDVVIADGRFHDAKGVIRAGKGVAMEHFGVTE
jgi:hypothetical protein